MSVANSHIQVLDINLKAPAIITKEAVKVMLKQPALTSQLEAAGKRKPGTCTRRGVIINLGSSASLRARSASGSPYIVSKHGLLGLTKSCAVSYGKQGIRCNVRTYRFTSRAITLVPELTRMYHNSRSRICQHAAHRRYRKQGSRNSRKYRPSWQASGA